MDRRDADAVPFLKTALSKADPVLASAAASALGRIGGDKAVKALSSVRDKTEIQSAVLDALLRSADQFKADRDLKKAAALYTELSRPGCPEHIRQAAARGLETMSKPPR